MCKVKAFIGKHRISKQIEQKLVDNAVLEEQPEATYQAHRSYKDKDVLRGVLLGGQIAKKHKRLTYLKKFAPKRTYLKKQQGQPKGLWYNKLSVSEKFKKMSNDVRVFSERECNSTMTPGVNDTITKNKKSNKKDFYVRL